MGSSDTLNGWWGKDGVFGYICWLVGGICYPSRGGVRGGLHTFCVVGCSKEWATHLLCSGGVGRSRPSCWGGEVLRNIVTITVRQVG